MKSLGVNWQKKVVFVCSFLLLALSSCSRSVPVVPAEHKSAPVAPKKIVSGKVTFTGFSQERLQQFRVIPETGADLFIPKNNKRYARVDGFWWIGRRSEWFKIPDFSEAYVDGAKISMSRPDGFGGVFRSGPMAIYTKEPPGLSLFAETGWKPRKGWPFQETAP